jgi:hypothetical protein
MIILQKRVIRSPEIQCPNQGSLSSADKASIVAKSWQAYKKARKKPDKPKRLAGQGLKGRNYHMEFR